MKVKITSASREEESAFNVPMSSFVITEEEIKLSGATSIPEALRLVPGLIVREIANGTYDVSIRGGIDGFPAYFYTYTNQSILAMIDNRPVFSNLQGGTYWQNLPISLSEIEKIEVVIGPASSLYGPNAVSGVINIISKQPDINQKYHVNSHFATGAKIVYGDAYAHVKLNPKLTLSGSINYELRSRYSSLFYNPKSELYEPIDSISFAFETDSVKALRYPTPDRSLSKLTTGVNLYYQPHPKVKLTAFANYNRNNALYSLGAVTSVSYHTNNSQTIGIRGNIGKTHLAFSYLNGLQGLTGQYEVNNYHYKNTDSYLDHEFTFLSKNLKIKPAISLQSAYINDKEFTVDVGQFGSFNGEGILYNAAASIKADWLIKRRLRLIAASRYDRYNYSNKGILSYQLIGNYKINQRHMLRALTSKSTNGSLLVPILLDTKNDAGPNTFLNLFGNKNLNLIHNTMYEVGYRTQLKNKTIIDIAFFHQRFDDFYVLIASAPVFNTNTNTTDINYTYQNIPLKVLQNGVTIAVQANMLQNRLQVRPNLTLQYTRALNYSPYYNEKGAFDNPNTGYVLEGHKDSTTNIDGDGTPNWFGGLNVIYHPSKKLYLSISSYYYGDHTLHMGQETNFANGQINDQEGSFIASKVLMNFTSHYQLFRQLDVYFNVKNITNRTANEGFGTDMIGRNFLLGFMLNF